MNNEWTPLFSFKIFTSLELFYINLKSCNLLPYEIYYVKNQNRLLHRVFFFNKNTRSIFAVFVNLFYFKLNNKNKEHYFAKYSF